jgi:transposase
LKGREKLSEEEKEELEEIFVGEGEIKEVYDFKERFRKWYKRSEGEGVCEAALLQFKGFLDECRNSSIKELVKLGKTLEQWQREILNYFVTGASNGFAEGLNNKIKLVKRGGYGYANREIFRMKVMAELN